MKVAEVDVAVIGGGAAGLVAAAGTAALGARTILIERNRLGGECTWTGCVPSKALLHAAHRAHLLRQSESIGIRADDISVDFEAVMTAVRATRQSIYEKSESPEYLKSLGIRTLHADARFLDPRTLQIERDGRTRDIRFKRAAIVASGSRPFVPVIAGLDSVDFLTTDTLFELETLPKRLAILGCGAVGVEMAQAFSRLGSAVTLISHDDRLLPTVDEDAAKQLLAAFRSESIAVHLRSSLSQVSQAEDGIRIEISGDGEPLHEQVSHLLLATGRIANTAGLGLEAAGVDYDRHGIPVDDYCRSNVRHILASGDVTTAPNLTHVAENMSKAAVLNALTGLPLWKREREVIPIVVYTDPEIALVGRSEQDLETDGVPYDIIELPYAKIDRAVIEGHEDGYVRIYHRFGKVMGATIVGAQAGELIAEYALAMRNGLRLPALSETVHAYPTMMLGARRAADQMYVRSLRPCMVRAFQLAFGYSGKIPKYVGTRLIV